MAAAVTSIFVPGCAKGGSVAVTMTEAVFATLIAVGVNRDAHLLQHVGQALGAEDRLLFVAGLVQAHNDAIADQLVIANALDRDEILETEWRLAARAAEAEASAISRIETIRMAQKGSSPSSKR